MRAWRWTIAIFVVLYAIQSLFMAVFTTSMKFGWAHMTREMVRFAPLTEATSVLQLAIWWAAIVLLFFVGWKLVRRERALVVFAGAFVLDVGNWLSFKLGSVYNQTFDAGEQKFDYVLLGVLAVLGAAIWFIERDEPGGVRA